jgi:hypothetical protein
MSLLISQTLFLIFPWFTLISFILFCRVFIFTCQSFLSSTHTEIYLFSLSSLKSYDYSCLRLFQRSIYTHISIMPVYVFFIFFITLFILFVAACFNYLSLFAFFPHSDLQSTINSNLFLFHLNNYILTTFICFTPT